jgi:hypothetical protein
MNSTELTTKQDLFNLEERIVNKFTTLLKIKPADQKEFLKSADVRKMLGISAGTLQTLRINGSLTFTKLNGTLYYEYDDVIAALNKNKTNFKVK